MYEHISLEALYKNKCTRIANNNSILFISYISAAINIIS